VQSPVAKPLSSTSASLDGARNILPQAGKIQDSWSYFLILERLKKNCSRSERGFLGFGEASAKEQV